MSEGQDGQQEMDRSGRMTGFRKVLHPGPRTRRRLLWVAIAVLVLIALVIAPGYYALQPGFVARNTTLSVEYKSWSASKHADVPCQSCHAAPSLTAQVAYSARMLGEFYRSLVSPGRKLDIFVQPTNAACQHCHTELVSASPKGDLIIPHRAHVEILKMQCVKCHAYLVHAKSPEGKNTPPMAACLTCHDGKQAKNACVTCHTSKAAPESHKAADWLVVHPAQQKSVDCAACHGWTKDWCADCHSRRPPSHTAGWRTAHPLAVKTNRDCEACHTASSCARCHGDVPQLNFDPTVKLVR